MVASAQRRTCCLVLAMLGLCVPLGSAAGRQEPSPHPDVGQRWIPTDVDWANPVYQTTFDDTTELQNWKLEGGKRMSIENGKLVLASEPEDRTNHLVCWLKREIPGDFLLEFSVRPQNRHDGLNIVFFTMRGRNGESVFDPALPLRDGNYSQYHSGALNGYHISYWAADRGTANLRKSFGFHLVATGKDLIAGAPAEAFQVVRLYKRGAKIRLMVDDIVSVAFDDDGKTFGPALTQSGWVALRQMGHTVRCEYDHLKIFPLKPAATSRHPMCMWTTTGVRSACSSTFRSLRPGPGGTDQALPFRRTESVSVPSVRSQSVSTKYGFFAGSASTTPLTVPADSPDRATG